MPVRLIHFQMRLLWIYQQLTLTAERGRFRIMPDICDTPDKSSEKAWWFIFASTKLLVKTDSEGLLVPFVHSAQDIGVTVTRQRRIGNIAGTPCFAAETTDRMLPSFPWKRTSLRILYGTLRDDFFKMALVAVHLLQWDRTAVFCGSCGSRLSEGEGMAPKECPECKRLVFPRLSPAVIVLIERGDELLLARGTRFPEAMYSVLAGFVEPGESLEEAVYREVKEEVGITVKDVRYFGSQAWPFPDSLMIGFTALYDHGEISLDESEIMDAGWFRADNLPTIPGSISIARQLIDWFVQKHGATSSTF